MKYLVLVFMIFTSFSLFAQKDVEIHEAGIKITLPNDDWKKMPVHRPNFHTFRRAGARDTSDKPVVPEITISVEHLKPYTPLTEYSLHKQKNFQKLKNYKVEKVFTNKDGMLKLDYAVGNKASYLDGNNVKHIFYFIHLVEEVKGVQILIDIPSSAFPNYEEELVSIIRSLEYK